MKAKLIDSRQQWGDVCQTAHALSDTSDVSIVCKSKCDTRCQSPISMCCCGENHALQYCLCIASYHGSSLTSQSMYTNTGCKPSYQRFCLGILLKIIKV
jgi:hypothetical protein